jgi:hypothetical protein
MVMSELRGEGLGKSNRKNNDEGNKYGSGGNVDLFSSMMMSFKGDVPGQGHHR